VKFSHDHTHTWMCTVSTRETYFNMSMVENSQLAHDDPMVDNHSILLCRDTKDFT
jgi:hypothetical protein